MNTPVLIIAYKRFHNLAATLHFIDHIREVLIVIDGPKSPKDAAKVDMTYYVAQHYAESRANVSIIRRETNLGGPIGIPSAISEASARWDFFCILEEDCLPLSPSFPLYIDQCLKTKRISRDSNIFSLFNPYSSLLSAGYGSFPLIWGWCISSDLWQAYLSFANSCNSNVFRYSFLHVFRLVASSSPVLRRFYFSRFVFACINYLSLCGKWPNWDGKFLAFCLINNYKTTFPANSLIVNIGIGSDSQNTKSSSPLHLHPIDLSTTALLDDEYCVDTMSRNDFLVLKYLFRHCRNPLPILYKILKSFAFS